MGGRLRSARRLVNVKCFAYLCLVYVCTVLLQVTSDALAHQGYDLQLTRYDETFYTTGMEHSPTSATGTAWERTPWHAVQSAAWGALRSASA